MRPWPISPNRSKRPCHSGSANATDWVTRRHLPRKPHTCVCLGGSSGGSVQFPVLGPLRIWYRISMGLQWPHTASALSSASGWFSDGSGWLAADKALCPLHLRARRVCLASGSSCNVVCPVVPRVLFVPLVLLWYVFRNEVRFRFNVHHHLESCPLQGFTAHPNPWAKRYPRGGLGTNLRLPRRSLSVIFVSSPWAKKCFHSNIRAAVHCTPARQCFRMVLVRSTVTLAGQVLVFIVGVSAAWS